MAQRQGARAQECEALLARAQVLRVIGGEDHCVRVDLTAALTLVNETGALVYEPFIREELARLHNDESALREAVRLYRQIGATGHARRLHSELSPRPVR